MIKVLLVDDHAIMRDGLKEILASVEGFELVGEAANGNDALAELSRKQADMIVMDMSMPGISGISLIEQIKSRYPALSVLVLTMLDDPQIALRTLKSGANGYITKDRPAVELIAALRKVASGGRYVDASLTERMLFDEVREGMPHDKLSSREMEVFRMLVQGNSLNEIAEQLFISSKTVSAHKAQMLRKMGVKNMAELIRYALQNDLFA